MFTRLRFVAFLSTGRQRQSLPPTVIFVVCNYHETRSSTGGFRLPKLVSSASKTLEDRRIRFKTPLELPCRW